MPIEYSRSWLALSQGVPLRLSGAENTVFGHDISLACRKQGVRESLRYGGLFADYYKPLIVYTGQG
jgi:hypothetical protein